MTVEKWNESWKDDNWIPERIGRLTKVSDTTKNKELVEDSDIFYGGENIGNWESFAQGVL